jgi:hypothetical protein
MHQEIQKEVKSLIKLLVDGQYSQVETLTNGVRLPADQIRNAIIQYGRRLIEPPSEAYGLMDVIAIHATEARKWSVEMPLWTAEEGRSDLSIELTLIENNGIFTIELDGIHVL